MRIVYTDAPIMIAGEASLNQYLAATLCGPGSVSYPRDMDRDTGVAMIPGAILGCIKHGLVAENQIVNAVARSTRCARSTVIGMIGALTGEDPDRHLFGRARGNLYDLQRVQKGSRDFPGFMIAG